MRISDWSSDVCSSDLLAPTLNAAVVVQSRVRMSRLKAYAGLFAEHGDFDVPPYATVGLAWTATPALTAAFDFQRIAYSRVRALGNDFDAPGQPGDRDGPGFGWRDIHRSEAQTSELPSL